MAGALDPILEAIREARSTAPQDTRLATVTSLNSSGCFVRFDGETAASTRAYAILAHVGVGVNDRVLMQRVGSTWIVSGRIGSGGVWRTDWTPTDSGYPMAVSWARWTRIGNTVTVQCKAAVTRTFTGPLYVTLPANARTGHPIGYEGVVGSAAAHNPGVAIRTGVACIGVPNLDAVAFYDSGSTAEWGSGNFPWQWSNGGAGADAIGFNITYETNP